MRNLFIASAVAVSLFSVFAAATSQTISSPIEQETGLNKSRIIQLENLTELEKTEVLDFDARYHLHSVKLMSLLTYRSSFPNFSIRNLVDAVRYNLNPVTFNFVRCLWEEETDAESVIRFFGNCKLAVTDTPFFVRQVMLYANHEQEAVAERVRLDVLEKIRQNMTKGEFHFSVDVHVESLYKTIGRIIDKMNFFISPDVSLHFIGKIELFELMKREPELCFDKILEKYNVFKVKWLNFENLMHRLSPNKTEAEYDVLRKKYFATKRKDYIGQFMFNYHVVYGHSQENQDDGYAAWNYVHAILVIKEINVTPIIESLLKSFNRLRDSIKDCAHEDRFMSGLPRVMEIICGLNGKAPDDLEVLNQVLWGLKDYRDFHNFLFNKPIEYYDTIFASDAFARFKKNKTTKFTYADFYELFTGKKG